MPHVGQPFALLDPSMRRQADENGGGRPPFTVADATNEQEGFDARPDSSDALCPLSWHRR